MEAFLTTLPPYVHDFLNKQPATDVFNLLRELICFAVLYSEDRDRITSKTTELLKKKENAESDSVVPEISTDIETINEESEEEEEERVSVEQESLSLKVGEKGMNNHTSAQVVHSQQNVINTFPEWWGHRESQPTIKQDKQSVVKKEEVASPVADNTSLWVNWETPTVQKPMARARSQIIPDLRSYLDPTPARSATINTAPKRNSVATTKPDIKGRNTTTGDPKTVRRVSSPVTQATKVSINEKANTKKQAPKTNSATNGVSRSASSSVSMPRQNAALRARAEHARQQQEEMERKKQLANKQQLGSSTSLRLKQRANSGIDWDKIKADRRKTISDTTKE